MLHQLDEACHRLCPCRLRPGICTRTNRRDHHLCHERFCDQGHAQTHRPCGILRSSLGFAGTADERMLKRPHEAKFTHGRTAMPAVPGFTVGEAFGGGACSPYGCADLRNRPLPAPVRAPDGQDALVIALQWGHQGAAARADWPGQPRWCLP
jgi:hypothetical protein